MRSATNLFALSMPLLASAAPMFRRTLSQTDATVIQFALVLEDFESTFYREAIKKYQPADFEKAGYSSVAVATEQLAQISFDEDTHKSALTAILKSYGIEPLQGCQFNLDPVLADVATTMAAARLVENTGVSAYLGAAHVLDDPRVLTAAGSILTNEARHETILNVLNGGASIPQAFDIPLSPPQVLAIAGPFISGCDLGIKGNDPLTITNTGPIGAGTLLTFQAKGIDAAAGQQLFCNMIVGGAPLAISLPVDQCVVPDGISGPVAVSITNDAQPLIGADIVDQDPSTTVSGPTFIFLDFEEKQQTLAQLVLTPDSPLNKNLNGVSGVATDCPAGQSCEPVESNTTNTISPEQASSSVEAATNVASAPATAETQTYEGDIIPMMPSGAAEPPAEPAPTADGTLAPIGSDGLPLPTETVNSAGSDGLPLPTPAPEDASAESIPPAGGAGAASDDGDIVPAVPSAPAPEANAPPAGGDIVPVVNVASEPGSAPEVTEAGDVSVSTPEEGATIDIA